MVDIAGDLGTSIRAPGLTNIGNLLTVSAHGGQQSGFSPDTTATNQLSKVVKEKIKSGGQLTLEDIASSMGSATNEIKRAVISACYAAGYNYNTIKRLFPNLEQIVVPSTDKATSAVYDEYLLKKEPTAFQYSGRNLSPYFSITPSSTNVVRKASDWLTPKEAKGVEIPLTSKEKDLVKRMGTDSTNASQVYSGKAYRPATAYMRDLDAISQWHKEQLKKATNAAQIDAALEETRRRIYSLE